MATRAMPIGETVCIAHQSLFQRLFTLLSLPPIAGHHKSPVLRHQIMRNHHVRLPHVLTGKHAAVMASAPACRGSRAVTVLRGQR